MHVTKPLSIIACIGSIIPTAIVALIWYINLSAIASPIDWALVILLILWIGWIDFKGCTFIFYRVITRFKRKPALSFIHAADFEQQLSMMDNRKLSNIAQGLSAAGTSAFVRQRRHETSAETHQRLMTLIREQKRFFDDNKTAQK